MHMMSFECAGGEASNVKTLLSNKAAGIFKLHA